MNAFDAERRLTYVKTPEVPSESLENTPDPLPESVPHAPVGAALNRYAMIAGHTLRVADGIDDPAAREEWRQRVLAEQRELAQRLNASSESVGQDVMNEAA